MIIRILIIYFFPFYLFAQEGGTGKLKSLIDSCKTENCLDAIIKTLKKDDNKEMISRFPLSLPLKLTNTDLSSIFGKRFHPIDKKIKNHFGIDLKGEIGQFVYAPADGVVVLTKKSNRGYGNRVKIKHHYGFETFFAHLSMILVKKNEIIKKGTIIGLVGNSGKSTAPHLHYEIFKNNERINPSIIIKNL